MGPVPENTHPRGVVASAATEHDPTSRDASKQRQPFALPYVSPLTRYGVSITGDEKLTRILMPPAPLWKRLDFIFLTLGCTYLLLSMTAAPVVVLFTGAGARPVTPSTVLQFVFGSIQYILVLVGMGFAMRWYLKRKPVIIESDPKGMRILDLAPPTKKNQPSEIWMRREGIYHIAYVSHANAIIVRCQGHEIVEIPLRYDAIACQELAHVMRVLTGISNSDHPTSEKETGDKALGDLSAGNRTSRAFN